MKADVYLNDPTEIYSALAPAWRSFCADVTTQVQNTLGQVVSWRDADDIIFPIHPFSDFIDTTQGDGIWRDRRSLFVAEVKDPRRCVRHGFNSAGQVVIAQRERFSRLLLRGEGYFDVVGAWHENEGKYREMPTRPHFTRYSLDGDSRITNIFDYSPTEEDHLSLETFCWNQNRLVEVYSQTFDGGNGIPGWAKDLSAEEQAALYRQATTLYREFMPSRAICRYLYAEGGTLTGVEQNQLHRPNDVTVVYARSQGDTVESVFEELAPLLSKQIVATLKRAKEHFPLRAAALFYSAEHIHTGLPWGLGVLPAGAESRDLTDIEVYSTHLPWESLKPALQKAVNRFIIAVEASPQYRDSDAPRAYRELLWHVALRVAKELQGTKAVERGFTIIPIDDHGDIDPREDFRDCVGKGDAAYFPGMLHE
jgi:hypothetical protein